MKGMLLDLETLESGRPFEIHPDGTQDAVLLLHGYGGSPMDMHYIAPRLAESGLAVSVPRLPGAGTDITDLSKTHRSDWLRRAYDGWLDLKGRYKRVSILGYSMGGALALCMASKLHPHRLALLAPAIRLSVKGLWLAPVLPFLPLLRSSWQEEEEPDLQRREHGRHYWKYQDTKSAAQLYKLCRETRRQLGKVQAPTLVIQSEKDPTVPLKVLDILNKRLPRGIDRQLIVSRCRHDLPQGPDKEKVADAVIDWLLNDSRT